MMLGSRGKGKKNCDEEEKMRGHVIDNLGGKEEDAKAKGFLPEEDTKCGGQRSTRGI